MISDHHLGAGQELGAVQGLRFRAALRPPFALVGAEVQQERVLVVRRAERRAEGSDQWDLQVPQLEVLDLHPVPLGVSLYQPSRDIDVA